jgi:hypothetical protein
MRRSTTNILILYVVSNEIVTQGNLTWVIQLFLEAGLPLMGIQLAWYAFVMCILILLTNGWYVAHQIDSSVEDDMIVQDCLP